MSALPWISHRFQRTPAGTRRPLCLYCSNGQQFQNKCGEWAWKSVHHGQLAVPCRLDYPGPAQDEHHPA